MFVFVNEKEHYHQIGWDMLKGQNTEKYRVECQNIWIESRVLVQRDQQ